MGIVRCILQIITLNQEAKCLVFSEHITMLDLIKNLLKANNIHFKLIKDTNSLQKNIQEFKKDVFMNVLLMPYSFGANGLNLIEATHVLLVEPTLNRAQEVQAIGRVHRIGQTRPTVVYRFIMRNTIEELVFNMLKVNGNYSARNQPHIDTNKPNSSKAIAQADKVESNLKNIIRISDIQTLFLNL